MHHPADSVPVYSSGGSGIAPITWMLIALAVGITIAIVGYILKFRDERKR